MPDRRTSGIGVVLGIAMCLVGGPVGSANAQSSSPAGSPGAAGSHAIPVALGPVTWTMGGTKSKGFTADPIPGDLAQDVDGTSVLVGTVRDGKGRPTAAGWRSVDGSHWTRVDWDASKPSAAGGIVAAASGFVAVGGGDGAGLIWNSPDGVSWTTASVPDAVFMDITQTSRGLVVVGVADPGPSGIPTAWTSTDGTTWDSTPLGPRGIPSLVAASPDGTLVAAGAIHDPKRDLLLAVWTSADGLGWSESSLSALPQVPTTVNDLTWSRLGFTLAVGHDADHSQLASVLVSPDGITWSPSLRVGGGVVTALGTMGPDTIAFGIDQTWRTTDGTAWREEDQKGFKRYAVGAVTTLQDGRLLIAAQRSTGPSTSRMATWVGQSATSPLAWTRDKGSDFEPGAGVTDLTQFAGSTVVMAGQVTDNDGDTTAAIWSSMDGSPWTRDVFEAPERSIVTGIAATTDGLVAVGLDLTGEGLVWSSTNGQDWDLTRVPDTSFTDVEVSQDRVVVLGRVLSTGVPTVWTGSELDPATWQPTTVATEGIPQFVAVTADGHEVVVGVVVGTDGKPGVAAWHSADASTWTQVALDGLAPGPTTAGSLESTPGGFVMSFYEYRQGSAAGSIWTSPDGLTWQQTLGVPDGPVVALGMAGTDIVAFGTGRSWWSVDGLEWWVVPEPGFRKASIRAVLTLPSGVIMAAGQQAGKRGTSSLATWSGIAVQEGVGLPR